MHHQDLQLFIRVEFVITCALSSYTMKPDSGVNIAQKKIPKNKHSVPSKKNLKKKWIKNNQNKNTPSLTAF